MVLEVKSRVIFTWGPAHSPFGTNIGLGCLTACTQVLSHVFIRQEQYPDALMDFLFGYDYVSA